MFTNSYQQTFSCTDHLHARNSRIVFVMMYNKCKLLTAEGAKLFAFIFNINKKSILKLKLVKSKTIFHRNKFILLKTFVRQNISQS